MTIVKPIRLSIVSSILPLLKNTTSTFKAELGNLMLLVEDVYVETVPRLSFVFLHIL